MVSLETVGSWDQTACGLMHPDVFRDEGWFIKALSSGHNSSGGWIPSSLPLFPHQLPG